jgi:MFS family permease
MAGFFTYLANSSFVMIDHYGLSPTLYSVAFGVNAAAFFGAAQLNGPLCERFGIVRVVKSSVAACGTVMLAMFAYFAGGGDRLAVLIVLYFIASGLMGLVIPTTSVLALEKHGAIAGTASALLGTLQMLTGAVVMAVVGLFTDGRPLPLVAAWRQVLIAVSHVVHVGGRQRVWQRDEAVTASHACPLPKDAPAAALARDAPISGRVASRPPSSTSRCPASRASFMRTRRMRSGWSTPPDRHAGHLLAGLAGDLIGYRRVYLVRRAVAMASLFATFAGSSAC